MEHLCYLEMVDVTASQKYAYAWAVSSQEMFSEWSINEAWLHGLINSTGQITALSFTPNKNTCQNYMKQNK